MCVAIVIPDNWDPARLILWSTAIARAKGDDVLIVRPRRQLNSIRTRRKKTASAARTESSPFATFIRQVASDFVVRGLGEKNGKRSGKANRRADASTRSVFLKELDHADLVEGVKTLIRNLRVTTLIVPRHRGVRFSSDEFAAERQLLLEASCETLQLRPGEGDGPKYQSILVGSNGKKGASPALNLGAKLATSKAVDVTALYVNPQQDRPQQPAGREIAERFVKSSLKEQAKKVTPDAVVDPDVPHALSAYATAKGHDLIVLGRGSDSAAEPPSRCSVSEKLLNELEDRTVVVVRKPIPLSERLLRVSERLKNRFIPQLERTARVEMVNRLNGCSKGDFDFFFLIIVATMLAALGLALDSPPVVIGAMLVAPLMAPMLGVGLSVVQGNRFMAGGCMVTIRRGFLAAFLTGCAVGLIRLAFTSDPTQEMANRGSPGILDLMVAFVSGGVAAYAFGRPHLLSVVPGIAIATALVPPVATAGMSLSTWKLDLALGAMLLFISNFVAIVLGSAICLWFVGMRGPRRFCPFATWARRSMFGMFAGAVSLAAFTTFSSNHPLLQSAGIEPLENAEAPLPDQLAAELAADPAESSTVIAAQQDPASAEMLEKQQLQEVEVVLEPRAADGQAATADVTLIVPNEIWEVELEGIVAKQRGPGWVTLDLPGREQWEKQKRWLTTRQKKGLESPDFYDALEKHIARRLGPGPEADLAEPML